jgi:RNA polymerase sigma-70 factor (ECF subfamily)
LSERDLVVRAQRGDDRAYESLVRRYQELAFRTAFLITGDAGDAEDAAQSAFLKAYLHLSRFRSSAPFRPWILQIVANEARNTRRGRWRHLQRGRDGDDAAGEMPDREPDVELQTIAAERSAWLVAHIDALSAADRQAILCRYALDLSEAEMAAVLGCARGTVKSRLHRALARLRARLEPEMASGDDRSGGEGR